MEESERRIKMKIVQEFQDGEKESHSLREQILLEIS